MSTTPLRDVPALVSSREPFEGNSMSAQHVKAHPKGYDVGYTGHLPKAEEGRYQDDLRAAGKLYVVYSYATPIAWGPLDGPLYVPDVRYSVTTSKHQGIVRRARV